MEQKKTIIISILNKRKLTVSITDHNRVFSYSMLFQLLPGVAAVVSSLGAAVVSPVATWNKIKLT